MIDIVKTVVIEAGCEISKAVNALRRGGLVIYPTETSYGIGADSSNAKAVAKVYRVKRRPKEKLLSVIVGSHLIAKHHVKFDSQTLRLVRRFMPGPLTLVSPPKSESRRTSSGRQTSSGIAWRIPSHWLALDIAKRFGKPIIATSANVSGHPPMYKIADIKRVFMGKVDVIIDAGNLPKRKPSTIFDVHAMKILRTGPVSRTMINTALRGKRGR